MVEYRLFYDSKYQRGNSKQVWREQPKGLVRAHLGHQIEATDTSTIKVPVVAICKRGAKTVRETHYVYITAATAKKHTIRLRRLSVSQDAV